MRVGVFVFKPKARKPQTQKQNKQKTKAKKVSCQVKHNLFNVTDYL